MSTAHRLIAPLAKVAMAGSTGAQGGADHPFVGRFVGSELVGHTQSGFDETNLTSGPFIGAEQMRQAIADSGRISLYGIQFDFDKDGVKAESKPALDEIGQLLTAGAMLKPTVVGYTDAKGSADYNTDLSRQRAANRTTAIVREYGIDSARLQQQRGRMRKQLKGRAGAAVNLISHSALPANSFHRQTASLLSISNALRHIAALDAASRVSVQARGLR